MLAERQRILSIRLRVLTALARLRAKEGDLSEAVETAKRLSALDPYREESSRLLMELLAASGQRGLALVEHARVERVLREDLQLVPDSTTRALAEKIRRGQPTEFRDVTSAAHEGAQASSALPFLYAPDDRSALAILPFVNLTGDVREDHVVECLTEDVAAELVRERWPLTITTPFGSNTHSVKQALGELVTRVDYVVSGSVRRDGDRFRALVRLTEAKTGRHLWTERVNTDAKRSIALQDLSQRIVAKLAPAIRMVEIGQVIRKPVESLTAYELYLHATAICRQSREGNAAALRMLRRAIDLDPKFGLAYGLAARCFHLQRLMGWSNPADPALYDGVRLAHRAADLSEGDPEALWMAGLAMAVIDGNMEDGQYLIGRSLAISQSNASAWIAGCFVNAHSGNTSVAIEHFQRAQAVNPDDTSQHLQWHAAATAYFIEGRYEEADCATDAALKEAPNYPGSLRLRIAVAGLSGRINVAQAAAQRLLKVNPGASIAGVRDYWQPMMAHTPDAIAAQIDGWRRAGMQEV